ENIALIRAREERDQVGVRGWMILRVAIVRAESFFEGELLLAAKLGRVVHVIAAIHDARRSPLHVLTGELRVQRLVNEYGLPCRPAAGGDETLRGELADADLCDPRIRGARRPVRR